MWKEGMSLSSTVVVKQQDEGPGLAMLAINTRILAYYLGWSIEKDIFLLKFQCWTPTTVKDSTPELNVAA